MSRVEGCRDSSVRKGTDIDEWIWLCRELLATNRSLCEGFAATRASDADGDGEPREPDIALLRTEFERLQDVFASGRSNAALHRLHQTG